VEKDGIISVIDNAEKEDVLDDGFYKKETFFRINGGLKDFRDGVESIAKELDVEFWDLFTDMLSCVDHSCYNDDGIHFNEKGHFFIAKHILWHMCGEDLEKIDVSSEIDDIFRMEFDARAYYFVKYNEMYFDLGEKIVYDDSLIDLVKQKNEKVGEDARRNGYLRFVSDVENNKKRLIQAICEL